MFSITQIESNPALAFESLLEKFTNLLQPAGVRVVPCGPEGISHFNRLPPELQLRTLIQFQTYVSVFEDAVKAGKNIKDDNQMVWRIFHRLGVHPLKELMSALGPNDMIEIYNSECIQVFRTIRFFSVCSYTLDELLCRPFWELFAREESVTKSLLTVAGKVLANEINSIHYWHMGLHTVDEIASSLHYHAVIENKIIAPLYNTDGKAVAFIHTFEVKSCMPTVELIR